MVHKKLGRKSKEDANHPWTASPKGTY